MAMNIEAAECLTEKTCKLLDENHPDKTKFSAMSKALATDVAMDTAIDTMQIFGGYSTNKNGDIERLMRDAKITQIFEGSNEIQNLVIGNHLYKEAGILEENG
jgi:acyl-CoA dehydrogenase